MHQAASTAADTCAPHRYAATALPFTQPSPWTPGSLTGIVSLSVNNTGNVSALFTVNSTGCCLTSASGCTPGSVTVGPAQQALLLPLAAQRLNFSVGEPLHASHFDICKVYEHGELCGV